MHYCNLSMKVALTFFGIHGFEAEMDQKNIPRVKFASFLPVQMDAISLLRISTMFFNRDLWRTGPCSTIIQNPLPTLCLQGKLSNRCLEPRAVPSRLCHPSFYLFQSSWRWWWDRITKKWKNILFSFLFSIFSQPQVKQSYLIIFTTRPYSQACV